jgi:uncharacterized RDD family membrane protein YckC
MRGMIFCKRCGNYAADGLDECPKCNVSLSQSGHPSMVGGLIMNAAPARARGGMGTAGAMFGSSSMMEPAGHLQRIVARIIDGLVVGIICIVGLAPLIAISDMLGPIGVLVWISVVVFIALVVYEPYFIATKGATPGKSAMGLRVVSKDGGPVGAGQSVARFLVRSLVESVFLLMLVPLFTQRRQGLHDMAVGTYVVRA